MTGLLHNPHPHAAHMWLLAAGGWQLQLAVTGSWQWQARRAPIEAVRLFLPKFRCGAAVAAFS
jgi:hypothetical protein